VSDAKQDLSHLLSSATIMNILTINVGSSSVRLVVYQWQAQAVHRLAKFYVAWVDDQTQQIDVVLQQFLNRDGMSEIAVIVHRVVHGGERYHTACLIDEELEQEISRLASLAPLHNPRALSWIRRCRELMTDVPHVAVFDTAFFTNLPVVATTYALPAAIRQAYHLRRYGFHGIAHQAIWWQWHTLHPEHFGKGRVISLQLGSGCSITAIKDGRPQDTSMGFSPLAGLVMATRCGDLDPGLILYLQRELAWSPEKIEQLLSHQSGLLGLSGETGDMRVLLASKSPEAALAVDVFCYRIRQYIGAYLVVLGGVDGILFGGGIGENSALIRAKVLTALQGFGIELDETKNQVADGQPTCISSSSSIVEVWVTPVDEAYALAQEAYHLMT